VRPKFIKYEFSRQEYLFSNFPILLLITLFYFDFQKKRFKYSKKNKIQQIEPNKLIKSLTTELLKMQKLSHLLYFFVKPPKITIYTHINIKQPFTLINLKK